MCVGKNDLTNGINMLNNAKKIVKELTTKPPKVKIASSGLITRKDKKNLDKNVTETNKRLKNYCRQKDIGYIDNSNITEDSLGIKKLHLNRKGNSFLAKNLLKYLTNVWLSSDTTGHDSVPKISKYSAKDNTVEELKSQTNVSKIPISSNLPFDNDTNDDKQTNILKNARLKHPKKVCLSHININSIRNKLDSLFEFTYGLVDFLAVSETKLDSSFPTGQFNLPGFRTPYRKDLSAKSGGLLIYVNSNIPSKMLKIPDCPSDIQVIPVEINLKKQKWLVIAIYRP